MSKLSEEKKESIKASIRFWESEKQFCLDKHDIMGAVQCEILADNLRKEIGESKYE